MRMHPVALVSSLFFPMLGAACGGGSGATGPSGPPVVTAVNGATAPAGAIGATVIIEGQNFGNAPGAVLFSNGSGGTVPAVIAAAGDWTASFIVTTVPAGAATGPLVVQATGGSSTPVTFTILQNVPFSPSTVSWTSTSALPKGLSGHSMDAAILRSPSTTTHVVFVLGGEDSAGALQNAIYYATIGNSGAVGAFTATTALPESVAFARVFIATPRNSPVTSIGYLYVMGGITTAAGQRTTAIYRGTLAADGTVSSWTSAGTLPAPLSSFGEAVVFGNLYIWGGATTGNAPVATVYRTTIDASGALGTWQSLTPLPFKRAYFGAGAFGEFLYAFGGDSGTVTPNDSSLSSSAISDVVYAKLDLHTRAITAAGWVLNSASLKKAVSKHRTVVAGGNVLVTAGLYAGASTGSSEESYAQINADGSVGSFNGATGANTISSNGGGNVFNHAEVGYVDGSGAFHVLVAGGDDVNTPGTKHKGVFYY
jgi:IPT/TIG domain-containing protein